MDWFGKVENVKEFVLDVGVFNFIRREAPGDAYCRWSIGRKVVMSREMFLLGLNVRGAEGGFGFDILS